MIEVLFIGILDDHHSKEAGSVSIIAVEATTNASAFSKKDGIQYKWVKVVITWGGGGVDPWSG